MELVKKRFKNVKTREKALEIINELRNDLLTNTRMLYNEK